MAYQLCTLSTRSKLALLSGAFAVGMILFGGLAIVTLGTVKVHGPHYQRVVLSKDLLADVLPPPAYIIESYLTAHLLAAESDRDQRQQLVKHYMQLKQAYADRQKFWQATLADGELKREVNEGSREPAERFFEAFDRELIPAVEQGDAAAVRKVLETRLAPLYATHRGSVNRIVELATQAAAETEAQVSQIVLWRTWGMVLTGLGLMVAVTGLTWCLARTISKQERRTQDYLRESTLARAMIDQAPLNVMFADKDFKLQYLNPASVKTLRSLEHLLPVKVDQLVGQSIDIFHKVPSRVRTLLDNPANLPHRASIQFGSAVLDLNVSAIYDHAQQRLGTMVAWEEVTKTRSMEREVQRAAEMARIVNLVNSNAATLASSAEELSSISSQMTSNASETSTQANVVSVASEQVSKNMQTVATGVDEMNAAIREIAKNASDSSRVAQQAVTDAQSANATISKLGDSSAEIGNVLKVITSIAEQTNLLALNATIEAARAGEAGKGFAVVANEVKELAKETARATEDIGRKVKAIQSDTASAVDSTRRICDVITQIHDISNTIASAVEEQTATATEMSRNVGEAAKGTAEIARNIASVAQAAQSTMQGAANCQQAASELARMAVELQQLGSSQEEHASEPVRLQRAEGTAGGRANRGTELHSRSAALSGSKA